MVTLAVFPSVQAADLVRVRLEAAGVKVFSPDENVGAFLAYEGPMVAGIRLQVAEADAVRARELLADAGASAEGSMTQDAGAS